MKVKYITTTNKHFFDVSLPLDDEMKLKVATPEVRIF